MSGTRGFKGGAGVSLWCSIMSPSANTGFPESSSKSVAPKHLSGFLDLSSARVELGSSSIVLYPYGAFQDFDRASVFVRFVEEVRRPCGDVVELFLLGWWKVLVTGLELLDAALEHGPG
jgi:hypothetical protein